MRVIELTDINDDLLLPWLDLYETSFLPPEKMLVSNVLDVLKRKPLGEAEGEHILAAVDENGAFIGLAWYEMSHDTTAACIWYLAVSTDARNKGVGSWLYNEVMDRARSEGAEIAVFEVEIPEEADSPERADLAKRRISFYHRQGARLLKGICYIQSVGDHQPSIPMHIMVHPFRAMGPEEAFKIAKHVLGDAPERVGEVGWEWLMEDD